MRTVICSGQRSGGSSTRALREALRRLEDAATDSSNISTHDGWQVTSPRLELPRDVAEEVNAALALPADDAALREVCLRVVAETRKRDEYARTAEVFVNNYTSPGAIVDEVLGKERGHGE